MQKTLGIELEHDRVLGEYDQWTEENNPEGKKGVVCMIASGYEYPTNCIVSACSQANKIPTKEIGIAQGVFLTKISSDCVIPDAKWTNINFYKGGTKAAKEFDSYVKGLKDDECMALIVSDTAIKKHQDEQTTRMIAKTLTAFGIPESEIGLLTYRAGWCFIGNKSSRKISQRKFSGKPRDARRNFGI